jgi:hypothetical protein
MTRLLCASVLVLGAGAAHAVPIEIGIGGPNPFFVDPLYFIPPSGSNPDPFGLEGPGNGVDFAVTPNMGVISACGAGGGCDLSISINLQTPVFQNPQFPAKSQNPQVPQGAPTPAVPVVADSIWTVQNNSGVSITDAYLLFTSVDFSGGYPDVLMALDQNKYEVVSVGAGPDEAFYGALALGNLAPGASTQVTVRYIVASNLPDDGTDLIAPPLGVAGLTNVPEPTALVLVSVGLGAMSLVQRHRRA